MAMPFPAAGLPQLTDHTTMRKLSLNVVTQKGPGSMRVTGPTQLHIPVVERGCEVIEDVDRAEMLWFACRFTEFGGWLFQDAGVLVCAMHWTDRALGYALELGDQRVIAYTFTQKAMIATESVTQRRVWASLIPPFEYRDALTPRLRAAILRQRS